MSGKIILFACKLAHNSWLTRCQPIEMGLCKGLSTNSEGRQGSWKSSHAFRAFRSQHVAACRIGEGQAPAPEVPRCRLIAHRHRGGICHGWEQQLPPMRRAVFIFFLYGSRMVPELQFMVPSCFDGWAPGHCGSKCMDVHGFPTCLLEDFSSMPIVLQCFPRQTAEKGCYCPSARSCSSTRVRKTTHASRSSVGGRMGSQLTSHRTRPPRVSQNLSAMISSSIIQTHRMSCCPIIKHTG